MAKKILTRKMISKQKQVRELPTLWERFSAGYRDELAQLANTLFTFVIIIAAALYVYAQPPCANIG